MARDPAIVEAQELWRTDRKEAMLVLVRRINELNAEIQEIDTVDAPSHTNLTRFVIVALAVCLIATVAGLVVATGVFNRHDPAVQEWWSYSAPAADEFMSSLKTAVVICITDASGDGDFSSLFLSYMLEASDYQDRFEQVEYPYAAKDAWDNISRGMTQYTLFAYAVDDDIASGLSTGELSGITVQYLENGRAYMREAAKQIKKLTGEDASFLVMEDAG